MDELVHFNGKFWVNPADGSPGREIEHGEALKAVIEGRAVMMKGGMPRKEVVDAQSE